MSQIPSVTQRYYDQTGSHPYSYLDFNTSLSVDELDQFRKNLLANLSLLKLHKHRIRSNEFNQLVNYHEYSLNILNNMQNIKLAEYHNPYNQARLEGQIQSGVEIQNPFQDRLRPVYDSHGRVHLVPTDQFNQKYTQEWQTQFDENIHNPPSYLLPPSNVWNLPYKK